MAMSSRSALFLHREWLSKSAPASVVRSIRRGFNLPFCPLALSRKGHVSSNNKLYCALAKGSSQCLVEHSIVGERAPSVVQENIAWRRVVSCQQPLPWHIPPRSSAASCDPRLLPQVSLHRGLSIVSSRETPRHSTNAMAPFSHASMNITIALFTAVFSKFGRSCRSFSPRCAWRALEGFDWTRGTAHSSDT